MYINIKLDELKDVAQLEYNKFAANPSAQLREVILLVVVNKINF